MKSLLQKLGLAALITMAGIFIFIQLTGPHGIRAAFENRERIQTLQQENAELTREIERRKERLRLLEQDREEQELEIRRRLRRQRKDSFDFYLPPPEAAPENTPAP